MPKQTRTPDVFDLLTEPDAAQSAPEDATPETDGDAADVADAGRQPAMLSRRVAVAVVGLVVVASLGLSGFLGWRLHRVDQNAAAGRAALETAKNYAIILTTLDTGDIDRNYAQVVEGATGKFRDEYSQGSAQLRQILIDNKAAGRGVVLDAAVKSATRTKVDVLLFVDQSVSNAVLPAPRIDRNRVQMTMELVGDRWLASNVDIM